MALPHDYDIQFQLLDLLDTSQDGAMECGNVYKRLADRFPELEADDVSIPFGDRVSHWANRVQFARLHLLLQGYLLPSYLSGRGVWVISPAGRAYIHHMRELADQLLDELGKS